jgi:hypothetical protein
MKLKDFGPTNIKVSSMGLGMAALGRPGYINLGHGMKKQPLCWMIYVNQHKFTGIIGVSWGGNS